MNRIPHTIYNVIPQNIMLISIQFAFPPSKWLTQRKRKVAHQISQTIVDDSFFFGKERLWTRFRSGEVCAQVVMCHLHGGKVAERSLQLCDICHWISSHGQNGARSDSSKSNSALSRSVPLPMRVCALFNACLLLGALDCNCILIHSNVIKVIYVYILQLVKLSKRFQFSALIWFM